MPYRYQNTDTKRVDKIGTKYYLNTLYPDIPIVEGDSYIITTMGDRLDLLAQDFYNDISLWWIIASANALPGDSIYIPIGMQIRIPVDVQGAVNQYKQLNANR